MVLSQLEDVNVDWEVSWLNTDDTRQWLPLRKRIGPAILLGLLII